MTVRPYWYHRPDQNFPPPSVTRPSECADAERLDLMWTRPGMSRKQQASLANEWCAALPSLANVRLLWISSRVPQELFDAACTIPNLAGMWVGQASNLQSIAALRDAKSLTHFQLCHATKLTSIEPLTGMTKLRWLGIENLKLVHDLGPISGLTDLEGLTVEGSVWAAQRVQSLSPLSGLTRLGYISLANTRVDHPSLSPLFGLSSLKGAIFPKWFDEREIDEVRRRNPGLDVN